MRQFFDIQAARGDVGRHQHANMTAFEVAQRTGARALAFVAVNRSSGDTVFIELFSKVVGAVFGAGENQHLLPVALTDHQRQQFPLTLFIYKVNVLRHLLRGGVAARDFHLAWVIQQLLGKSFDLIGEGGGKQQVLAFRRQARQHAADIVDKAHIEHAVRFIQHQHFHMGEIDRVLLRQVEQTARRRHQQIDAAAQLHHLRIDADAAEYHQRTQVQVFTVVADVFADLRRQFTRRG